ncbi:MAG: IPT/TIG domain-containing protein [Parachlamydiaceae bacterium]|nr:IPT/TIG domain-containing protein [Parachlamydiaceae bacterium]
MKKIVYFFITSFFLFLSINSKVEGFVPPVWSPPVEISGPIAGVASSPIVKTDYHGRFVAAWIINTEVQYAELPLFGTWTPPSTIATNAKVLGGFGAPPIGFDINVNGDAVIIWIDDPSGRIYGSKRPYGQNWSTPVPISNPPVTADAQMPALAIANNGIAVAVWSLSDGTSQQVQASYLLNGSFAWSAPVTLSPIIPPDPNIQDFFSKIAVDSLGNFTLLWEHFTGPGQELQTAVFSSDTLTWTSPISITANSAGLFDSKIVVDSVGNATAVWVDALTPLFNNTIFGAFRPLLGSWTSPIQISDDLVDNRRPSLAVDGTGKVTTIWTHEIPADRQILYSESLPGSQTWSLPGVVQPSGVAFSSFTSLSSNFSGDLLALWGGPGFLNGINAAKKPAGFTWLPSNQIDSGTITGALSGSVSPEGATVATWKRIEDKIMASTCYSLIPPPTVTSLTPNFGPFYGGTVVTITGSHFTGTTEVNFGGISATSFVVINDNTITAVSPAHVPGLVNVIVTTPMGSSTVSPLNLFYFIPFPLITNVVPNHAAPFENIQVSIYGQGFINTLSVLFGNKPALNFIVVSDTLILATVPSFAFEQTILITVVTPVGNSNGFPFNIRIEIQPVRNVKGFQIENKFATQKDIINILQWDPPIEGPQPIKYLIFRKSLKSHPIGKVSADQFFFLDHNRKKGKKYTYFIVAIDAEENESDPKKITIK